MSNLKLDLVTIQLPLDVRIEEFKSDDEKMKDVNDFITEIVEKAKIEVETRKVAEGKAKLDAFGLQSSHRRKPQSQIANIERVARLVGEQDCMDSQDESETDLWEADSTSRCSRSPHNETHINSTRRTKMEKERMRLRWLEIANFPSTQQVIEDCTQPSTSQHNNNPDKPHIVESLSPVPSFSSEFSSEENDSISPTIKMKKIKDSDSIETLTEVPLTQIDIEELFTQQKPIDLERTSSEEVKLNLFETTFLTEGNVTCKNVELCISKSGCIETKKSKFKKSGFAQHAFKALKEQRTRAAIWKYEHERGFHTELYHSLDLLVRDEIYESGRCIFVCEGAGGDTCLVLLGERSQLANVHKACRIRLFPPYSRKFIDYRGGFVSFYYDALRCVPVEKV